MTLEHDQSQAAEQLELNTGIGTDLRDLREQAGKSIEDVANATRIQANYLVALEDGRQQDLPGATYAIGFLRTYSDYLGMDANKAVERFKDEEAVRTNPTPLVFPTPVGETRRPGWRLALLSLVLAGAVYGTWISIQNIGGVDLDRILPPPERLTDFLKGNDPKNVLLVSEKKVEAGTESPKTEKSQPSKRPGALKSTKSEPAGAVKTVSAKPAPDPKTAKTVSTPAVAAADRPAKPVTAPRQVETKPVQAAAVNQGDNSGPKPSAEAQKPAKIASAENMAAADARSAASVDRTSMGTAASSQPGTSSTDTSSGSSTLESSATQQHGAQATLESENQTSDRPAGPQDDSIAIPREDPESAPPEAPPSPSQVASAGNEPDSLTPDIQAAERLSTDQSTATLPQSRQPQGQPRVFGASNVGARVVVRAHSDSWVQIQGPNKETLLTRILHAGDTYLAPSRDDLVLVTGNAGAVEIIVDGVSLGMIGEFGQVRRDLSLDPARVRSELANR